jgi:transposase-like protein
MGEEMLAARGFSVTYETMRQWPQIRPEVRQPHRAASLAVAITATSMRSLSPSPGITIGFGAP